MAMLTKAALFETVARVCDFNQNEAEVIVEGILDSIVRTVRAGQVAGLRPPMLY
jgi:nucleoid DNA-binding protein